MASELIREINRLASMQAHPAFDPVYYSNNYADQLQGITAIDHYLDFGEALGYKPNFVFDPEWYIHTYKIRTSSSPLKEYIEVGEKMGRNPSALLDVAWLRAKYSAKIMGDSPLVFYVANKETEFLSPNQWFDLTFYYDKNPDVAATGVDGYEHFVNWGVYEGRKASENFDAEFIWHKYLSNNKKINPFLAFLKYQKELGWVGKANGTRITVSDEIKRSIAKGEYFESNLTRHSGTKIAKAFAFYLPQFHTIKENDQWWGTGFTEWTNLARGTPRFSGHTQPKVPRDLGFYNLNDEKIIARQVDLAKSIGLHGFCFYYYNFDGKRLLETPLDLFITTNTAKFPFCLMWANENWTRRWDGQEKDVLIAQTYRRADEVRLIADIASYMKKDSYYRIDDRPFFLLYRSDIIPDCKNTLIRWREIFKAEHGLNPLIIMAQTFGNIDPTVFGFDAAIEFPPHKFGSTLPPINDELEILDENFQGDVRSYDALIEQSLSDFPKQYPLIKTVVTAWDNDPRKQGTGLVIHGSTPAKFAKWVSLLIDQIKHHPVFGERLFFVNAWNEWCEGAYLEPDTHHGFAYANALARSVSTNAAGERLKMILVGHDAFPAGSQQLLLSIGATLKFKFGVDIAFILMAGGPMVKDYLNISNTYVVDPNTDYWPDLNQQIATLASSGFMHVITNTIFTGHTIDSLKNRRIKIVSLIHELPKIITTAGGQAHLKKILTCSDIVVYPNLFVKDALTKAFGRPIQTGVVRPQGMYKNLVPKLKINLREILSLTAESKLVINVGYADLRKGVDLFIQAAALMHSANPNIHFIWVGARDPAIQAWLIADSPNVHFVDFTDNVPSLLAEADVFFLSSREDPFPSVVMEALSFGLPVIAFDKAGGASELLKDEKLGSVVESGSIHSVIQKILLHLDQPRSDFRSEIEDYRRSFVTKHFDFSEYCADLLNISASTVKVSVIVPNYNYSRYLKDRLSSIFAQSYPIFEVIVLDDASEDDSVQKLEEIADITDRDFVLIENRLNSDNVFSQWKRGLEVARGDYIWIAEADDLSDPGFLRRMIGHILDEDALFAFCDSRAVDADGQIIYENYKGYYSSLFQGALAQTQIFDSRKFLSEFLSVQNMVLNASSVVWKRSTLENAFAGFDDREMDLLKVAGDWKIYVKACLCGGNVAYDATPLNVHRRHRESVTGKIDIEQHVAEIIEMHKYINETMGTQSYRLSQDQYVTAVRQHLVTG